MAFRPGRKTKRALAVLAVVLGLAVVVVLAADTGAVNRYLDRRTIGLMAAVAARAPAAPAPGPLSYASAEELERLTRPPADDHLVITRAPMRRHRLGEPGLVEEMLSFPSAIPLAHAESNRAVAYLWRHGPLGERPLVVWLPGQYVVDLAFVPISWFTREIVRQGADVLLLVPPYHLERTPAGFESGDAVFATDLDDHLRTFAQELSDVRRLVPWLRAQGVRRLGGFGGSVGAMILARASGFDATFDFLTLFIPMVRMADVLDAPAAAPMRERLAREGRSLDDLRRAYASLDPTPAPPLPPLFPGRVSALYGRYDQVANVPALMRWAQAWGVTRLHAYDRGHALALFQRRMYADYAEILAADLAP